MRSNVPLQARKKLPRRPGEQGLRWYGVTTRSARRTCHLRKRGVRAAPQEPGDPREDNETNSRDGTARDQIQTTHTYVTSRLTSS